MTTQATARRSEGPLAIKERELLNTRLADPKNWLGPLADPKFALQTHDDSTWTDPNCFFHAAIDGLNELGISDISMPQMRTNVKHWLETNAPDAAEMSAWHTSHRPRLERVGNMPYASMVVMKSAWIAHCQGYADKFTGDEWTCKALANLYNCNVNVHLRTHTVPYQPTIRRQNTHTLNLALYKVESEIESEQWSHYCSTRPIVPREVAVREERTSDCMRANPFALVNPIALPNFAGTPGRQQALATSVGVAGGCPARGGSAAVEVPSPAVATGAGPVDADPPPARGEDERRMGGGSLRTSTQTEGSVSIPGPLPGPRAGRESRYSRRTTGGSQPGNTTYISRRRQRTTGRSAATMPGHTGTPTGLTSRQTSYGPGS